MTSIILKKFVSSKDIIAIIDSLHGDYLKEFKKKLKLELAYSEVGTLNGSNLFISAWVGEESSMNSSDFITQKIELQWVKNELGKTNKL